MQLSHGFDLENFPFVIALDQLDTHVFLVNVNTLKRVPLINLKQVHRNDKIYDI